MLGLVPPPVFKDPVPRMTWTQHACLAGATTCTVDSVYPSVIPLKQCFPTSGTLRQSLPGLTAPAPGIHVLDQLGGSKIWTSGVAADPKFKSGCRTHVGQDSVFTSCISFYRYFIVIFFNLRYNSLKV